jgi:ribonuclease-3
MSTSPNFNEFAESIGLAFHDLDLLKRAFTHRSYINEHRGSNLAHNERLEFLGDAVLELSVTEFLFSKYPEKPEGELTAIRAAMVNTIAISKAAELRGMGEYLLLSKGEAKDTGRGRQYILANTFEAVIGAIFLDQGYDTANKFIAESLFSMSDEIVATKSWQDAKSAFQEQAQEHESITPTYETLREEGPDHDKIFTVGVFLNDEKVAEGNGPSKQDAQQAAAEKALEKKGW